MTAPLDDQALEKGLLAFSLASATQVSRLEYMLQRDDGLIQKQIRVGEWTRALEFGRGARLATGFRSLGPASIACCPERKS